MLDAYRATVLAKDVDAFMALYDEEVRIFDTWDSWSDEWSSASWRLMATEWFASVGANLVDVAVEDAQFNVSPDLAMAHAFVTYRQITPDGTEIRSMRSRLTWGLARKAGRWVIVHQHTSSPLARGASPIDGH